MTSEFHNVQGGCTPHVAETSATPNRFAEADNVCELILQVCGAASMCWVGGPGNLEFDSTKALSVADQAIDRMIEIGWATPADRRKNVSASGDSQQEGGVV